ncbi:hypothetical protein ACFWR9_32710 [Streptomyces sp. NPDC058534]|uniref:hypothetical protein n=1 Tax=Streptomyces sp. NPDC058534 TaxID=3346541 RepID=UPI003666BA9D
MHAVYAALIALPGVVVGPDDANELADSLWAHATQEDSLEHVVVRAQTADRVDLLLFLREGSHPDPVRQAADLIRGCYRASGTLPLKYAAPGEPGLDGPWADAS